MLDRTLDAFKRLEIPAGVDWELLVVNNNCSDDTDNVLVRYKQTLPLQRLFEPTPGHSTARNCAIEAASGEWILWTDDDVLVDPRWLSEYVDAIRSNPEFSFAGGTIEPCFESTPPRWLGRHLPNLEGAFAIIRRELVTRPLKFDASEIDHNVEQLFGANMGFRTDLLQQYRFDPNLGLVGNNPMRGDETELIGRLTEAGYRGLWVGSARVQHFIPKSRMTTRYLWGFFLGCGQAQTRLSGPAEVSKLFGRPRWALRAYLSSWAAARALAPFKNSLWLHHFRRAATCAGVIKETCLSRSANL